HEMNTDLGTINMNGRLYDPTENRFLTPDPLIKNPANGQTLNHYSYVENSPTNLTDPTGYVSCAFVHTGECEDYSAPGASGGFTGAGTDAVHGGTGYIGDGDQNHSSDPGDNTAELWNNANAADAAAAQAHTNHTTNGSDDRGPVTAEIAFSTDACVSDPMSGACLEPDHPDYDPDGLTKALAASAGGALGIGVIVGAAIATGPAIVVLGEVGATCGGTGVCQKVADEIEAALPEAEVTAAEAEAGSAVAQEVVQKIVNTNGGSAAAEINATIARSQALRQTVSALQGELARVRISPGDDVEEAAMKMGFSSKEKYFEYYDEIRHSLAATKQLLPPDAEW
ncbi:RHS repeat-associated core domain-containing protein, partial [Streptomyces sp. NPDC005574]|uniref:RHS repeat-associated core domain-containing protein n=1 Tax=Streptomyces sp. NPDC005574 TaxID=3156891 RepID=UPI0033AC658A